MTEYRHFAVGLRTLAGLIALAGLLGLSACGGGSGAPNNPFDTPGALTLVPSPLVVYSGNPATITVAGGQPPYSAFSSDQSALPVQSNVIGSTVNLLPDLVAADTSVTLTARDARGDSAVGAITIKPAPLVNSLTLKADGFGAGCPNPGGSASAVDALGQTFICAGQTGSVAVTLRNPVGGGLAGRLIRFDVVQGPFQFFTSGPGQPDTFALSFTVPTDQNGDAITRIRATPNASAQVVIVQATDLLTGTYVRGIFIVTNGADGGLLIVPDTVNITGPDTETCSSGVVTSFFIFGGTPPYTISNTFPQLLTVSPTVVDSSGAGFNATTRGACLSPAIVGITDAAGHTKTVEITNDVGDAAPATTTSFNPITITPSTVPALACGVPTTILASGGGTISTTGGTVTVTPAKALAVAVSREDVVTALPSGTAPPISIALSRVAPGPSPTPASVSLFISDGLQTKTVNIPIATPGTPCP